MNKRQPAAYNALMETLARWRDNGAFNDKPCWQPRCCIKPDSDTDRWEDEGGPVAITKDKDNED